MTTFDPDLLSHLRFDRLSPGNRFADLSGNGRAAQDGPDALVPDAHFGNCVELDDVDHELHVPFDPRLRLAESFSIEAWVEPRFDRRSMVLIECSAPSRLVGDIAYQLSLAPGGIVTRVDGGRPHIVPASLQSDTWHHVAMSRDAETSRLFVYLDGVLIGDRALPVSGELAESNALRIGYSGIRGRRFRGCVGSLRVYDRSRDISEIVDDAQIDRTIAPARLRPTPVIHIPFSEVGPGGAADLSGHGNDALPRGGASLVADGRFGTSVELDGAADHFEVMPSDALRFGDEFTVELWVRPSSAGLDRGLVEAHTGADEYPVSVRLDDGRLRSAVGGQELGTSDVRLETNVWQHVAAVWQGSVREIRYFVGGEPRTVEGEDRTDVALISSADACAIDIGRGAGPSAGAPAFFGGRIAGLRIYDRALEHGEINEDIFDDRHAAGDVFERRYPISFRLFDDDDENTLSIVDEGAVGRICHLALRNDGDIPIEFPARDLGAPGAENHHIELRFRPGTLDADSLVAITVLSAGWRVSHAVSSSGVQSLFGLAPDGFVLQPGRRHLVTLAHVHADPTGGARRTRVSLHYDSLRFVGDDTPLAGSRLEHMEVIGRRGHIRPPLRAGFLGSNTIVNNGKPNTLQLYLANPSLNEPIVLTGRSGGDAPTRLIVTFDEAPNGVTSRAWTIAERDRAEEFKFSVEPETGLDPPKRNTVGESTVWTIEVADDDLTLAPGGQFVLTIKDIVTTVESGITELRIRYENVPGFRDGDLAVAIQKSSFRLGRTDLTTLETDLAAASEAESEAWKNVDSEVHRLESEKGRLVELEGEIQATVTRVNDLRQVLKSREWFEKQERLIAEYQERLETFSKMGLDPDTLFSVQRESNSLLLVRGAVRSANEDAASYQTIFSDLQRRTDERNSLAHHIMNIWSSGLEQLKREHAAASRELALAEAALRRATQGEFAGIWNEAPLHPLDVSGTIRSTGEILDAHGPVVGYGTIVLWSGVEVPGGWALCDGTTVNGYTTPDLRAIQQRLLPDGPTFITKVPPDLPEPQRQRDVPGAGAPDEARAMETS